MEEVNGQMANTLEVGVDSLFTVMAVRKFESNATCDDSIVLGND